MYRKIIEIKGDPLTPDLVTLECGHTLSHITDFYFCVGSLIECDECQENLTT